MRKTKALSSKNLQPITPRLTTAPPPTQATGGEASPLEKELNFNCGNESKSRESSPEPVTVESIPGFLIWVKNEPFDFGVLSQFPCPKIGINILRKIAEYCRDKPGLFPNLTLNQWLHICRYKLLWDNQDYCVAYFRVFDILSRQCGFWEKRKQISKSSKDEVTVNVCDEEEGTSKPDVEGIDETFYKAVKQGQDQDLKEFKVDTLQFILFLYIQHFRRLHKKLMIRPSNLKQSGENEIWPKLWKTNPNSPTSKRSSGPGPGGSGPNVPEMQQAELIIAGLEEIIDFLMIFNPKLMTRERPDMRNKLLCNLANEHRPDAISTYIMKALSFLLGAASTSLDREFKTLESCLTLPEISKRLKHNRMTKTVSKSRLMKWILQHLKINPWGPSCIPIPKVALPIITGVFHKDGESFKKNRLFWNTQNFPKAWFLVSGVEKQVIHLDSLEPMSSIKIHRCVDSHIYIIGTHQIIIMQKCHRVTINLGVVTKMVKVADCSEITLCGVGRLFLLNDVRFSTFNLLTPSPPIVSGNKNREINLAPYNTTYPNLLSDMKAAGIGAKFQQWNKPLELTADGYSIDEKKTQQHSNVIILPTEKFTSTLFPFRSPSPEVSQALTSSPSLSELVPAPYFRRVETTSEKVEEIKKEFKDKLSESDEDANLIYQITLQRFKKWLKETGRIDQVMGLCSLQKTLQQKSSSPLVCSKGHDLNCIPKSLKNFFYSAGGYGVKFEKVKKHHKDRQDGVNEGSEAKAKYFGMGGQDSSDKS